ncbi:MAG: hypothetical protein ABEI11_04550 [Haloarculaceae archaeon]
MIDRDDGASGPAAAPDESTRTRRRIDPAPLAIGGLVGLAGLLFLLEPAVAPLRLGAVRARPVALSAAALAAGLALGAAVYLRRGRRLVGIAHAAGAVGWGLVVAGTALGSGPTLFAGVAVVVGGALFLAGETRRLR